MESGPRALLERGSIRQLSLCRQHVKDGLIDCPIHRSQHPLGLGDILQYLNHDLPIRSTRFCRTIAGN